MNQINLTVPQGWQCPLCLKIYSPTTPVCFTCPQTTKTTSNTGNITTKNLGVRK